MKILNTYANTIFWRAFKPDDTIYAIGLREGTIAPGKTGGFTDDSFPTIKVEIKKGSLTGEFLTKAGTHFAMGANLVVDKNGKLAEAAVDLTMAEQETVTRRDILVMDLRQFDATVTRTIKSSLEETFASSQSLSTTDKNSFTWNVGGKVGGKIKGVKAELSAGFKHSVEHALTQKYEESVRRAWGQSWEDKIPLEPGRIHVFDISWEVTLQNATATYFGQSAPVSAILAAKPQLTRMVSATTPGELAKEYQDILTSGAGRTSLAA